MKRRKDTIRIKHYLHAKWQIFALKAKLGSVSILYRLAILAVIAVLLCGGIALTQRSNKKLLAATTPSSTPAKSEQPAAQAATTPPEQPIATPVADSKPGLTTRPSSRPSAAVPNSMPPAIPTSSLTSIWVSVDRDNMNPTGVGLLVAVKVLPDTAHIVENGLTLFWTIDGTPADSKVFSMPAGQVTTQVPLQGNRGTHTYTVRVCATFKTSCLVTSPTTTIVLSEPTPTPYL